MSRDAPLDPSQRAALLAAKDELNWTSAQLARHVGLSARTIRAALLGEPCRSPTRRLLTLALVAPCGHCGAEGWPRCASCVLAEPDRKGHRGVIDSSRLELVATPGGPPPELRSTASIFEAGRQAGEALAEGFIAAHLAPRYESLAGARRHFRELHADGRHEPAPYYESPAHAPSRVRLYLGDCRDILPLVAPPSKRVLALADPPYGVNERTARASGGRGNGGSLRGGARKSRDWRLISGDGDAFDPSHLLAYQRLLVWGWNHYCNKMPPTPSTIAWWKRAESEPDDGADLEEAWTNLGGPARLFAHLWRGTCRASETGAKHLHPTQKPEAFYRWLFAGRGRGKPTVNPGDLVVAPYLGSGPEIRPTMELGLDFIGVDVEREYLDTAIKHRIEPALKAGKQLDIWKTKPRTEQLSLTGG